MEAEEAAAGGGGEDLARSSFGEEEAAGTAAPANGVAASPENNAGETTTNLRFLVTNTAAGSVIGKGGSTISDFQAQSGARIQLSRNHEYFPGTSDRVAVLSGSLADVLTAFQLIISKIIKDDNQDDTKSIQVKLLVPKTVCGAIIGKGGSNIKKFVEDSQASIKLSSQDQLLPGVIDRIVTIGGNVDQIIKAVTLILTKLTEESSYTETTSTPLVYPGLQNLRRNGPGPPMPVAYGAPSILSARGMMAPVIALQPPYQMALPVVEVGALTSSVTIGIPDEHIGFILGRAGKTLQELQQSSGAKIKVSDRGDFVTGTEYRKVTMIGSGEAIQAAQFLLTQKVQQSLASDYERDNTKQPNNNSLQNHQNQQP
ncbi:protein BTR1 [Selaginella moellendorffii]|uniref:protein BTR1 n=1 Tax=Selaginella moellendorffii TaxID=88036 RepID=UPI000D1C9CB7|nr:protein BTR1 [Selaginella moellendorffii]|eukprot:XP_024538828.1 protein BTR1 [Selaginella moellendorffii]